jgi:TolA-binding protein
LLDEIHILRAGSKLLQSAYSRLLADYLTSHPESASKVAWTGRTPVEELKKYHLDNANELDSAENKASLTLGDALKMNLQPMQEEMEELSAALQVSREAEASQREKIELLEFQLLKLKEKTAPAASKKDTKKEPVPMETTEEGEEGAAVAEEEATADAAPEEAEA